MAKIKRICSIPDCGKRVHGRGWCAAHYRRWMIHSDPLGGGPAKTPNGEVYRYFHEVALAYDGNECLPWPFARTKKGYGSLRADGRMQIVSRMVCERVNGPPPTPEHEAAHSCGKGHEGCVAKRHLDWKTPVENCADKMLHDTHNRGERHGIAKLTKEQAVEIMALKGMVRQSELAERFGVSQSTVSLIQRKKNWSWLAAKSEPA